MKNELLPFQMADITAKGNHDQAREISFNCAISKDIEEIRCQIARQLNISP